MISGAAWPYGVGLWRDFRLDLDSNLAVALRFPTGGRSHPDPWPPESALINVAMLERQDVAWFIDAACTCTGQTEFYGGRGQQRVPLAFLHDYVFGNYRRLYALCLAAGINDFNQAAIVARLLAAGAPADPDGRRREGSLIRGALARMPPQRVYRLFDRLRRQRINNRRTRAVVRTWLATRDLTFDALKYRGALRSSARHVHLSMSDELHPFLFEGPHSAPQWQTPLLETFRRARYDQRALFALPFTVAEGLAAAQGIDRARFLTRIAPQMTAHERARTIDRANREGADVAALDLGRMPLTRLCTLLASRPIAEVRADADRWRAALRRSSRRALTAGPAVEAPRVRAVLDASHSARGGAQRRNRPLAIAMGVSQLLATAVGDYRGVWTNGARDDLTVRASGQTDLVGPLLDVLRDDPDLVVVVSDGFENDPPGACGEVVRVFRERLDPEGRTAFVHVNPVFDAAGFQPRPLGRWIPTVGLNLAEDFPLRLAFARFTVGRAPLSELEGWLEARAAPWLEAA